MPSRATPLATMIAVMAIVLIGGPAVAPETAIAQRVAPDAYSVQSVRLWKQNASPVGWSSSLNRVIYNSLGSNGLWNAYSANPDGSDPECLTCSLPSFAGVGTATNRGASDVSPDGKYMLVTVAEAGAVGGADTAPGAGTDNNVWLYTTDGQHAWQLTNINAQGQQALALIWPRFDHTGNKIVWASAYAPALLNLGYWQLKVANIAWNSGVPSLSGTQTIEPAPSTFYEPYGFTADDQHIIFASNIHQSSLAIDQIDTIGVDGTGLTQLTQPAPESAVNYNEFAWYTPNGAAILYGTATDATSGGMDFWAMNPDGSDPQRLTYFNEPWDTEGLGYSITESLAWNPKDQNQFIAAVSSNINSISVNAYSVTLQPPSASSGLSEQIFNGQSFSQVLYTTTQNPSDGFNVPPEEATGISRPAPGVSTSNYGVRWSGALTVPNTGTYTFCVVADPQGQLLIGGQQVIDTLGNAGARACATASETGGRPVPIELNLEHPDAQAPAHAQLSWIPPGGSSPTLIPSSALTPAPSLLTPTLQPLTSDLRSHRHVANSPAHRGSPLR